MVVLLDGHPKLIRRFNRFLPWYWQIEIEEEEEKHHHDESGTAGLVMLKEAEQ
jgi:histone deacetylase complex regulatory component SIN3